MTSDMYTGTHVLLQDNDFYHPGLCFTLLTRFIVEFLLLSVLLGISELSFSRRQQPRGWDGPDLVQGLGRPSGLRERRARLPP